MMTGAVKPRLRRRAMKVRIFQSPNGALAGSQCRFRQRPRSRAILVLVRVSSQVGGIAIVRRLLNQAPQFQTACAQAD
jgi:hypothetical protein